MKQGDIYQLGKHKLLCGDSTNHKHIRELMRDEKADLVIADPPYNKNKGIIGDKQKEQDFIIFNDEWISNILKHLKYSGYCFIHGDTYSILSVYRNQIYQLDKIKRINFKQLITWSNGVGQGHNQDGRYSFATDCEYIILFHTGVYGKPLNTDEFPEENKKAYNYINNALKIENITRKELEKKIGTNLQHYITKSQFSRMNKEKYNQCKLLYPAGFFKSYEEYIKLFPDKPYFNNTWDNMGNVWNIHKLVPGSKLRNECGGHPTPKPYKLLERQIKTTTRENELILDPFLGSGQTLLAAEELGRKCYGIELDPKWCNLIIERWEKKTGKKARKLN